MKIKWAILVFLCGLVFACVPNSIVVKNFDSVPNPEKIVFGELKVVNIKPGIAYTLFIKRDTDGREFRVRCVKDKSGENFYWRLQPGKYTITSVQVFTGFGRIWVDFEVPEHGDAVYIGTLQMFMGMVSQMRIKDDMVVAKLALREKVPSNDYVVVKNLMKKEMMR